VRQGVSFVISIAFVLATTAQPPTAAALRGEIAGAYAAAARRYAALAALPPSPGTFVRTWSFATYLPPDAARAWLARNDPPGFRTASLLTLAAILDRQATGEPHILSNLVRSDFGRGKPTGFALLAREYTKTHRIPEVGKVQFGH
jgi:hypothetical protein